MTTSNDVAAVDMTTLDASKTTSAPNSSMLEFQWKIGSTLHSCFVDVAVLDESGITLTDLARQKLSHEIGPSSTLKFIHWSGDNAQYAVMDAENPAKFVPLDGDATTIPNVIDADTNIIHSGDVIGVLISRPAKRRTRDDDEDGDVDEEQEQNLYSDLGMLSN
jgi:hypothetical protein